MTKRKAIDFENIAIKCKLLSADIELDTVFYHINELSEEFDEEDLVIIYNYLLTLTKNEEILMHIIKCIDKIRDSLSIGPILDLLLDTNNSNNLRIMCAKELGNLKDTSVVTPLLYCLNDKHENYKLRLACADAIGRIGDKYAVSPLIDIVQDEEEKSVYVRESAAVALGMLGDSRAVDVLVSILESKKGFMDKFTFFKERIIEVLRKFNFSSGKILKALEHSLDDEAPCIRINAIESLMDSDYEEAYELIEKKLHDEDEEVRENALIALYNMRGREILDEVLDSDYSEDVKEKALDLINEYESEDKNE